MEKWEDIKFNAEKNIFLFARPQAVGGDWQDRRQRPRMPKAPHVQCITRFSCAGALAKDPAFFKFLAIIKHGRCAGRSEFFLRAEPEQSEGGRARRLKTARAWPRAAQHRFVACFTGNFFSKPLFSFLVFYCNFFSKPVLRCPRPRPRHLAPLCCASLHRPRSARAPLGGQMRSAPRNKIKMA